jgi:hypothetical protein
LGATSRNQTVELDKCQINEGKRIMPENVRFVDLDQYFNTSLDEEIHHKPGNDLKTVPHGICAFAGIPFDSKGIIQLSGSISKEKTGYDFPVEVSGIPVNQNGAKLHFLQGSSWHDQKGVKVGEYRIHYANGHTEIIPIVYQMNVADWWFLPGDQLPVEAQVAWTGDNARTRNLGYSIQFYKYTWINPFPMLVIKGIDFVSEGKESAPFLMAVTIE